MSVVTHASRDLPAAERVEAELRDRIRHGAYQQGAWLPPERQLCAELGVSRPVVREAIARLIQTRDVTRRPGCRARVGQAGPEHGARGRQRATPCSVAVVLPQVPAYVWSHAILRGVARALREAEPAYRPAVYDTHPSSGRYGSCREEEMLERLALEHIQRNGAAGVIIWQVADAATLPIIMAMRDTGIPVVFIDRCPRDWDCDYVGTDNRSAVRAAVEHLLGLGHRRVAFLTFATRITPVMEREAGYRDAMLAAGIEPPEQFVFATSGGPPASVAPAFRHFAALSPRPTAVVAVSDQHAFALIRECEAAGWRIPDDLSVVGFDDIEHYSPRPAMLTTLHQPFEQIGHDAARLLVRRTVAKDTGPPTFQHLVLPARLVVRASCARHGPVSDRS